MYSEIIRKLKVHISPAKNGNKNGTVPKLVKIIKDYKSL